MRKLEEQPWWDELVRLKDEFSLRELAERFGATPGAISNALKRNNIEREPSPPGPRWRRWVADDVHPPAAASVPTAAPPAVRSLAPQAGVVSTSANAVSVPPPPELLAPYADLLGDVPDDEIASFCGLPLAEVTAYRVAIGKGDLSELLPTAPPAVPAKAMATMADRSVIARWRDTAPGALFGYQVKMGGRQVLVVAPDLLSAASLAQGSDEGPIERIDLLGVAL